MSIRPIDYQVIIPKSVDVSDAKGQDIQRSVLIQQHLAESQNQQIQKNIRNVNARENIYKVTLNREKEGNKYTAGGKGRKMSSGSKQGKENSNDKGGSNGEGSTIDIRL